MTEPLREEQVPLEERFHRARPPWSRTIFTLKVILLPPMFLGSAAAIVYGAVWLSFSPPSQKVIGLFLIAVGFAVMVLAMWIALDRPKQWFAPGVNNEPVPGRRLPRWFRQKRRGFED